MPPTALTYRPMSLRCLTLGSAETSAPWKMPHRENINIVKREQKMTETFGRYNIFATLSLSLSLSLSLL